MSVDQPTKTYIERHEDRLQSTRDAFAGFHEKNCKSRKRGQPRGTSSGRPNPPLESVEHTAVVRWLRNNLEPIAANLGYEGPGWLHHSNEGNLGGVVPGVNAKNRGKMSGLPDFEIIIPSGGYTRLVIELKRRQGGDWRRIYPMTGKRAGGVEPGQRSWLADLGAAGARVAVCYGSDEAIKVISEYLRGLTP